MLPAQGPHCESDYNDDPSGILRSSKGDIWGRDGGTPKITSHSQSQMGPVILQLGKLKS